MGFFKKLKISLFGKKPIEIREMFQKEIDRNKVTKKITKKTDKIYTQQKVVDKYVAGLDKSQHTFTNKINQLFVKGTKIDENFFKQLENILILSDLGMKMTTEIINEIKKEIKEHHVSNQTMIKEIIADRIFVIYSNWSVVTTNIILKKDALNVILLVGVNGSGKTTTIAKLANYLMQDQQKVLLAAGDTFRAGAVNQLEEWAARLKVDLVKSKIEGQDPSSVIFDALKKAQSENYDVLLIDTAGRLQNKVNLMQELAKINKVILRHIPQDQLETLLVIDAITGQNGINQAQIFNDTADVNGIVLAKMDGTAKGGIVLSIKEKLNIPVKYIGLGEKINDFAEFNLEVYIYGLLKSWIDE